MAGWRRAATATGRRMRSPLLATSAAAAAAVLLFLPPLPLPLPLLVISSSGAQAANADHNHRPVGRRRLLVNLNSTPLPPVDLARRQCALGRQRPTPFRRHDDAAAAAFVSPPASAVDSAAAADSAADSAVASSSRLPRRHPEAVGVALRAERAERCPAAGSGRPGETPAASCFSSSFEPFVASRRGALSSVASLTIAPFLWSAATSPFTATAAAAPPGIILSYPGIEPLEPIYELREAIDLIVATLNKTGVDTNNKDSRRKGWTRLKKRLDKFFTAPMGGNGGPLAKMTERDAYEKIGREYVDAIQYAAGDEGVAQKDRETRYKGMEDTLDALEELRERLGAAIAAMETTMTDVAEEGGTEQEAAAAELTNSALEAQRSMRAWFDRVPTQDVAAVETLVQHIKSADKDRDGKLSQREMAAGLSDGERQVWERRVEKFGMRGKVERCLGFKLTETAYY